MEFREEEVMIKKVLPWLGLAFLIFYIKSDPSGAADVAKSIGGFIADVFRGIGTFFSNLVT